VTRYVATNLDIGHFTAANFDALAFLEAHEPDLVAVAQAIGTKPENLITARVELER